MKANTIFINKTGLSNLFTFSDKGLAKKFKKWIASEILPCISENQLLLNQ